MTLEANQAAQLQVMHALGHTPDPCVLYDEASAKAFLGYTIFKGGIGTWKDPCGNRNQLMASVPHILEMPHKTKLFGT